MNQFPINLYQNLITKFFLHFFYIFPGEPTWKTQEVHRKHNINPVDGYILANSHSILKMKTLND